MTVTMSHPEKVLFTWNSMFSNAYYGETHDYLFGTAGTVMHDESDQVLYLPKGKRVVDEAEARAASGAKAPGGYSDCTLPHMQNFFDCVAAATSRSVPSSWDFARP